MANLTLTFSTQNSARAGPQTGLIRFSHYFTALPSLRSPTHSFCGLNPQRPLKFIRIAESPAYRRLIRVQRIFCDLEAPLSVHSIFFIHYF